MIIKKINNKGLTAVELIVSFALVSIITISLFSVVNSYRDKENLESFKNSVTTYKNTLTKTIYTDINNNNGIAKVTKLTPDTPGTATFYDQKFQIDLTNGKTSTLKIVYHSKCFEVSRDSVTHKRNYVGNKTCSDDETLLNSNSLNIDYENSEYYVEYTDSNGNKDKFELPKIQGLRFNEISAEMKGDNFILIHIGLFHNDYGNQYDALHILVPSSDYYPGMY